MKSRGFTLIELLVVVAIISILTSIIVASISNARMKARDAKRISDLAQISQALELYYEEKGYYPQSGCGWDCNGYLLSYTNGWNLLATELSPYLSPLPNDPLGAPACPPWGGNCYTYAYGNVGRTVNSPQYDLTAQLEDPTNPFRCSIKSYFYYFNNLYSWCSFSDRMYEASP
jgi:type II secretion system protein G